MLFVAMLVGYILSPPVLVQAMVRIDPSSNFLCESVCRYYQVFQPLIGKSAIMSAIYQLESDAINFVAGQPPYRIGWKDGVYTISLHDHQLLQRILDERHQRSMQLGFESEKSSSSGFD